MHDLLMHIDKIHTTKMGAERLKKNLAIETPHIVDFCKQKIQSARCITRKGKNWYIDIDDIIITVNAHSFTIITAHKKKSLPL